jgi:ElaB/YqjD/DUF883 family membrane-anchored ribosome-binding protein
MAEIENPNNTGEPVVQRSTEEIRQDIAKGEENISQTVERIGERLQEKLDWRGYVKDSPYLAVGVAAGLGYLASGMFTKRTTPMERFMGSISEEVHDSLAGLRAGAVGFGLVKATLLGIATKAAATWIKNATSKAVASGGDRPRLRIARGLPR